MTVLLRGDLDHGYLLIHQAVLEDIETSGQPRPNAPGYALVSLNYNRVEQAFRQWVMAQAEFLNVLLDNYNATYQNHSARRRQTQVPGYAAEHRYGFPPHVHRRALEGAIERARAHDEEPFRGTARAKHPFWRYPRYRQRCQSQKPSPMQVHPPR
jgi:hypothetical protein